MGEVKSTTESSRPAAAGEGVSTGRTGVTSYLSRWLFPAIVLIALVLFSRFVQIYARADQAAFGSYPDEPSHYLAGLMVRDYAASGFPSSPLSYAVNYYLHVPYFAIGYWPPMFYGIEGLWMLLVGYQRSDVLWLIAVIYALVALTIYLQSLRWTGNVEACCAAFVFLSTPIILWSNCVVLTDGMVAMFGFWAILAFARYLESGSSRWAAGFGLLAALTILTKYSGLYLAAVPLGAILLTRGGWRHIFRLSFWVQPVMIAVIWAPWLALTYQYMKTGLPIADKMPVLPKIASAIPSFTSATGVLSFILILSWLLVPLRLRTLSATELVCWLAPPAVLVFLIISPVEVEPRYLITCLPPLTLLAVSNLAYWSRSLNASTWSRQATTVVLLLTTLYGVVGFKRLRPMPDNAQREISDFVLRSKGIRNSSVMVSPRAEGPLIAEIAMRDPSRSERILVRPNKIFAEMDWMGTRYRPLFETSAQLREFFDANPVDLAILPKVFTGTLLLHEQSLLETIKGEPGNWKPIAELGPANERVVAYQFYKPAVWNRLPEGLESRMRSKFQP